MSRSQILRVFVTQRLNAVVEEILAAFEETITKYEEEAVLSQQVISRQHALLCALNKPTMDAPAAGELPRPDRDVSTQHLLLPKENLPFNHQNQDLGYRMVLEPSSAEKKQEEQLQALDAAEIIQFTYNSRPPVKLRDDYQTLPDPRLEDPNRFLSVVLSSETEDSDDYSKDAADTRTASHKRPGLDRPGDGFGCKACSRNFSARRFLFRHVRAHVHDPKPVCGLCGEQFEGGNKLKLHLQTHMRQNVLQNQARTRNREQRLEQLSAFSQDVKAKESQTSGDSSQTLLKKRRRGRPRKNNEDANNQKEVKKRKKVT